MFVFTRCLLYAEVSQGAPTAFAEKTLMEEPPEEVVSEVSSLPSVGFAAGSYWLSTTMRSWCWTNLAAVHLTFLSEWFLDRRLIPERLLLFRRLIPDLPVVVQGRRRCLWRNQSLHGSAIERHGQDPCQGVLPIPCSPSIHKACPRRNGAMSPNISRTGGSIAAIINS